MIKGLRAQARALAAVAVLYFHRTAAPGADAPRAWCNLGQVGRLRSATHLRAKLHHTGHTQLAACKCSHSPCHYLQGKGVPARIWPPLCTLLYSLAQTSSWYR